MPDSRHPHPPALVDGDAGLWLVSTATTRCLVDLDTRVVRHPIDGLEDVHTPGRAWVLMTLIRCVVGEQLNWVLATSPARLPLPAQRGTGVVLDITPMSYPG